MLAISTAFADVVAFVVGVNAVVLLLAVARWMPPIWIGDDDD